MLGSTIELSAYLCRAWHSHDYNGNVTYTRVAESKIEEHSTVLFARKHIQFHDSVFDTESFIHCNGHRTRQFR